MPRLTVKELRKAMDIELETVWYRLVCKIATIADRQADMAIRSDRQTDQVIELERIVREQTETIQTITDKVNQLDAQADIDRKWNIEATKRILALEKRVNQFDENMNDVARQLASLFLASDGHYDQIGATYRKFDTLTQLAKESADTIAALTDKLAELAETVNGLSDDESLSHQWLDRQQQRIVALESSVKDLRREIRDGDYATLEEVAQLRSRVTTHEPQAISDAIRNAHNATMRMDIHSKWISQLFDRLNEGVKE